MFLEIVAVFLTFFLVLEIGVRVYLQDHLVYDVEMTKYAMTLKQDSGNPNIVFEHKPNAQAKLMGVWVRTNADGFRGPECPLARDGKKRLMFLGDSLTFGWGVEEKDTFKDILESQLNALVPTEIINTASGNYNVVMEANLFLEKGLKYHPDKVVLFYFIRDAEPTPHKSRFWALGYSELITLYWSSFHRLMVNLDPAKNGYQPYYSSLYQTGQPGLDATLKAFLLLKDTCQKQGISFQVVLLPELHELVNYPFTKEHRMIMGFLKANSIDAMDLAPYFYNYKNPMDLWVAPDDAHPNKKANFLFAKYSFDFIKKGLYLGQGL